MKSKEEVEKCILGIEASKAILAKMGITEQSTAFAVTMLKWAADLPMSKKETAMLEAKK